MKGELRIVLQILSGELRWKDINDCLDVEFLNNKECNIFRCESDEELKKWAIYYLVEFLTKPYNTTESKYLYSFNMYGEMKKTRKSFAKSKLKKWLKRGRKLKERECIVCWKMYHPKTKAKTYYCSIECNDKSRTMKYTNRYKEPLTLRDVNKVISDIKKER